MRRTAATSTAVAHPILGGIIGVLVAPGVAGAVVGVTGGFLVLAEGGRRKMRRRLDAATADLEAVTKRHEAVVDSSQEGIWVVDGDGRTHTVSRRMAELLGHPESDLTGVHLFDFLDEQGRTLIHGALQAVREGHSGRYEVLFVRADGSRIPTQVTLTATYDPEGRASSSVLLVNDVSDAKAAEAVGERRAMQDEVTGLASRALFLDRVRAGLLRARRQRTQVALVCIEIDGLGGLVDVYGSDRVDGILDEIGRRVHGCLRADEVASRWGDDAFMVLCEGMADDDGAAVFAERLVRTVTSPVDVSGAAAPVRVAASVGIIASRGLEEAEDLLGLAVAAVGRSRSARRYVAS